ncbi:hypothetical protein M8C21_023738, partial [Ambrosia artemisiifolia]
MPSLLACNPYIRRFGNHYVFTLPLKQDLIPLAFRRIR